MIRTFSRDTLEHVTCHVGHLEGTGLVDYSALPESPSPSPTSGSATWRDLIVPSLVLLACLLVGVWLGVTLRRRNRSDRPGGEPKVVTSALRR